MALQWTPDQAEKLLSLGKINQDQYNSFLARSNIGAGEPSEGQGNDAVIPPALSSNTSSSSQNSELLDSAANGVQWISEQMSNIFGETSKPKKDEPSVSMKAKALMSPETAQTLYDAKKITKAQYDKIMKLSPPSPKETSPSSAPAASAFADLPPVSLPGANLSAPNPQINASPAPALQGNPPPSAESQGFFDRLGSGVNEFVDGLTRKPPTTSSAPETAENLVTPEQALGIQGLIQPPPLHGVPLMQQPGISLSELPKIDQTGANQMKGALSKQGQISKEGGMAQAALQNEMANTYEENAQKLSASAEQDKRELDGILNTFKTTMNEIKETPIDPDRFWKNKTTGQKVMAGIGMLLASFGSRGGQNPAVKIINDAIERDIEAQKIDRAYSTTKVKLEANQNLYNMMRDKLKDDKLATNATMMLSLEKVKSQIAAQASKTNSELAVQNANYAIGQINQTMSGLQADLLANVMKAIEDKKPKTEDLAKLAVRVNGQNYYAFDHESAMAARKLTADAEPGINALDAIIKKAKSGSRFDIENDTDVKLLASMAQAAIKSQIIGTGPVTDSEREIVAEIVSDPSGFFTRRDKATQKLQTLKKSIEKKYLDSISTWLQIDPRPEKQFSTMEDR